MREYATVGMSSKELDEYGGQILKITELIWQAKTEKNFSEIPNQHNIQNTNTNLTQPNNTLYIYIVNYKL